MLKRHIVEVSKSHSSVGNPNFHESSSIETKNVVRMPKTNNYDFSDAQLPALGTVENLLIEGVEFPAFPTTSAKSEAFSSLGMSVWNLSSFNKTFRRNSFGTNSGLRSLSASKWLSIGLSIFMGLVNS